MHVFAVPDSLQELEDLLKSQNSSEEKIKVIKELVKNQQVHTGVSNVDHLKKFLNVLLSYTDYLFKSDPNKVSPGNLSRTLI